MLARDKSSRDPSPDQSTTGGGTSSHPPAIRLNSEDLSDVSGQTTPNPRRVASETTPLLPSRSSSPEPPYNTFFTNNNINPNKGFPKSSAQRSLIKFKSHAQKASLLAARLAQPETYKHAAVEAVRSIPAVILGMLLNILDGVSYGFIMFPAGKVFEGFGGMGVSMFFVTTVIAQLVYTFGGSKFAGGNGSMMIEVVPFFHILAASIVSEIGEDNPREVVATTMVAFMSSSLLTGMNDGNFQFLIHHIT